MAPKLLICNSNVVIVYYNNSNVGGAKGQNLQLSEKFIENQLYNSRWRKCYAVICTITNPDLYY